MRKRSIIATFGVVAALSVLPLASPTPHTTEAPKEGPSLPPLTSWGHLYTPDSMTVAESVLAPDPVAEVVVEPTPPEPKVAPMPEPTPTPEPTPPTVTDATYDGEMYIITAYARGDGYTPLNQKTASGTEPTAGRTVACSKEVPFGTRFYIPELGNTYTCEDRGGMIRGNHLDIYFDTVEEVDAFGKRKMKVVVLD